MGKARAESNVTRTTWIPKRPVETLSSRVIEKEADALRLKQQSSLEHINLKTLLQQPASISQTDRGCQPLQKKEAGSLQSLHQLALRITPHKPPTVSKDHHAQTALQRANSFPSRMKVVPEDHFRSRMMTVPEEKRRKLSLSSGLSSSLSYEDEDEDDRPLVIDTDITESGNKTSTGKTAVPRRSNLGAGVPSDPSAGS